MYFLIKNRFIQGLFFFLLWFARDTISGEKINEVSNQPVNRIISLAPHITEIIYKLGAQNRLVGRTEFCNYPPDTKFIPSVGGYLNIDYEKLVTLKPDLILQFPNRENQKRLEILGFRVENITNETIDEILEGILIIGRLLGVPGRAEILYNNIYDTLQMVHDISIEISGGRRALMLVGRTPGTLDKLYAVGRNSYLSQIWERVGGENTFSDISHRYFALNKEDLIVQSIDYILEFRPERDWSLHRIQKEKELWNFFSNLKAVRTSEIYIFTDPMYLIPGPRITKIAITFKNLLRKND
jgi:iron complex transport system substrate-binding protein